MLQLLTGVERGGGRRGGEVAQFPGHIVCEPVPVHLAVSFDLTDQHGRFVEGRAADLHGEFVPDVLGLDRFVQPLRECGAAGAYDGVLLLVRPACCDSSRTASSPALSMRLRTR